MSIQQNILSYLFSTIPAAEKQAWESEIVLNSALKADIRALRKLFSEKNVNTQADWKNIQKEAATDESQQKWLTECETLFQKIAHRDFQLAYMEGNVTEEEKEKYEAEKQNSPQLQQNEDNMKTLTDLLRATKHLNTARAAFKSANLPEIDWEEIEREIGEKIPETAPEDEKEEEKKKTKKIPLWKRPIFRMVAGIILLVGIGIAIFFRPQEKQYDNAHLIAYLQMPETLSGQMGGTQTSFEEMKMLADAKKYKEVISKIEAIPNATTDFNILLGFCYLQNKQNDKALTLLESLRNDENYGKDARLYIAFIHIFKGEREIARKELLDLLKEKPNKQISSTANKLLKDLEK